MHLLHFIFIIESANSRLRFFLPNTIHRDHATVCLNVCIPAECEKDSTLDIFALQREPHFKSVAHTRNSTLVFNLIFV